MIAKDHGNYNFGYDIVDPYGAKNFRKEQGDGYGNKVGSYGLHDIDGRVRLVNYVADGRGFHVKVQSNEPGVSGQDSAYAIYNGRDHGGHGGGVIHAGGLRIAHAPVVAKVPVAVGGYGYGHGPATGHGGYGYGH
ncbi:cuticle protein 14-like [Limulus polyphemus]|uniref:Cuticle protein 14-like n=1 Tax=Limulus polyphemus TaxID=6850 RepID=A0ABM1B6S0_LIMPO|nr:cuticle protein 14-like [Limulus polyphemus]